MLLLDYVSVERENVQILWFWIQNARDEAVLVPG